MNSKSPVVYLLLAVIWLIVAVVQYTEHHLTATVYLYGFAVIVFLSLAVYCYHKNKKEAADK